MRGNIVRSLRKEIILFLICTVSMMAVRWIANSDPGAKSVLVVQADGTTPIGNALIVVVDSGKTIYQTRTDKNGVFELPGNDAQALQLEISADGYITQKLLGQQIQNVQEKIRLIKAGALSGVLTETNNRPVAGVTLALSGNGGPYTTYSDANGHYGFGSMPSGAFYLSCKAKGYADIHDQRVEIIGGNSTELNLTLHHSSLFTGKVLDAETKLPLGNISVYLSGSGYYYDQTDKNGFFSFPDVAAGKYTIGVYNEGFKELRGETIDITEGETKTDNVLYLQPLDPSFQLYSYQQVFVPGEKVKVQVRSYRITALQCEVFRVSPEELKAKKSQWIREPQTLLSGRAPLSQWTKAIEIKDVTRWQIRMIEFPLSRNGLYLLRISYKDSQKIYPIFYTELGLVAKAAPDGLLLWSHRLSDSKPIPNVEIDTDSEYLQPPSVVRTTHTDSHGLAQFPMKSNESQYIWGFSGSDAAYVQLYTSANAADSIKAYIYTDRPVYRPGHTVHYRGVVRKENQDVYEIVSGFTTDLKIRDVTGTVIQQTKITTDRHGAFFGDLTISDEPSLGNYQIELSGTGSEPAIFKVLEYRKPEFEIKVLPDKTRYINGDTLQVKIAAAYYYGAPVAGKTVEYNVLDSPYYAWWNWDDSEDDEYNSEDEEYDYDYYGYGKVVTSGEVQLNDQGEGVITFSASKENYDRYLNIEAKITDESRREVTGTGRVLVTRGEFKLGIGTGGYVYNVGELIPFQVQCSDYDDHPLSVNLTVKGRYEQWNALKRTYDYVEVWSREIHTDAKGIAGISFTSPRTGYLQMELSGEDSRGNVITSNEYVWIAGTGENNWYYQRAIDVIPDRKNKNAGEKARVLINASKPNVYALVTLEGTALHKAEVVRLQGNSYLYNFNVLQQYAPTVYVGVSFTANKQFYTQTIPIQIHSPAKSLNIKISADKATYKPQETAQYTVQITDHQGKPVSADFSFGLVDESIYAVSPDLTPNIDKFFYGPKPNRVQTYYSFPPRYLGGADKDGNKEIRKDFPDTAFWAASIQTDASGKATVSVKLPDSLTTWRATVRAITDTTEVGSVISKIITTKDLIARLEPPRFFTQGDSLFLTGVVHNLTSTVQNVRAEVKVDDHLQLREGNSRQITLQPQEIKRIDWPVTVTKTGQTRLILTATSASDFDGMQMDLPVLPFGIERLVPFSGQTDVTTATSFTVPSTSQAQLNLYLTPSVAGMTFESLEYLTGYPYGCVEQTMSRFLPDVLVWQALDRLHIKKPELQAELPKQINAGFQRLYHFQHDDGGWGWWEHDQTDPYMTAYVIYGLSIAKAAGFESDSTRVANGINALKTIYDKEEGARPFILLALSYAGEKAFVASKIAESRLDRLGAYDLSVLALSARQIGDAETELKSIALLKTKASVTETYAFWPRRDDSYGWCDNDVETAAYALRALLHAEPNSELIPKIVRWLASKRQGSYWYSTKDTAATIISLMEYLESSKELTGQYQARVLINGNLIGEIAVTPDSAQNLTRQIVVKTPVLRAGENKLDIQMTGAGRLYYSGDIRFFESGNSAAAQNHGVSIKREYFRFQRVPNQHNYQNTFTEPLTGNVKIGEEILVRVTLEANHNYDYVILEDPLPSGFEVVNDPSDDYEWDYWYCRSEVHDEKAVFFTQTLWQGKQVLTYVIRAEVPGTVQVSPSHGWTMYLPEINGNGDGATMRVVE